MRGSHYVLEQRQWVPCPLGPTFAFFAEPANLARITPPWLGFRILTPPPLVMAAGLVIDYRVHVLGWPARWRSLISEYDPPYGSWTSSSPGRTAGGTTFTASGKKAAARSWRTVSATSRRWDPSGRP